MNPHPTSVNNVDYISNLNSQSSSSLQQQKQNKQKVSQKAMAASKLSAQDWKDLDKFINYLALKTVQVIVQARLGEKSRTKSKPHSSGSDWFNLAIRDLPEVQAEAKKALAGVFPAVGLSMCVEISLKTVEGDSMVLETWCVAMNEQCNNSVRVTHTVYSRLGLLLKSLISVTRVTPAYKLATRQGPDSFIICYRVYMGEPQLKFLGEGHSIVRVGQVTTPVGTVVLSVAYRTRLTLTPQKTIDRDGAIMVKSDHFKPDMSPKQFLQPTHVNCQPDHRSMVDELAAALEEGQPLDGEQQTAITNDNCAVNATLVTECVRPVRTDNKSDADHRNGSSTICKESHANFVDTGAKKVGAFAGDVVQWNNDGGEQPNREFFMPEAPFGDLLRRPDVVSTTCQNDRHDQQMSNGHGNNNHSNLNADALKNAGLNHDGAQGDVPGGNSSRRSSMDSSVAADDFVLVDLKPAFVGTDCGNELGTFYRECQSAPQLVSFGEQPSLAAQVNDLSHQLATFETRQVEFDEFVDALYLSDSSK